MSTAKKSKSVMKEISIDQIKCPKCGQSRMSKVENFNWAQMILSIITFGFYALVYAIWTSRIHDQKIKPGDRIKCLNCDARWVYEE